MIFNETKMDDDLLEIQPDQADKDQLGEQPITEEIAKLRADFQSRLIAASMRTEAVHAGMIDLDGLRLVDLSEVHLDNNDKVIGGRRIMTELRRNKPWLFGVASTSSAAIAPASQPVRQKTAMDMTDAEYNAARAAVTKYQF
jgi:hypothetical protein